MAQKTAAARVAAVFLLTVAAILGLLLWAVQAGGLEVGVGQLLRGIFIRYDTDVAVVLQLRFPRIAVALLGGMLMSVSGVLMQAVMRNPRADPGIIGVTSGAALSATVASLLLPALAVWAPLFSFFGGMVAFAIVYLLAWNGQVSPVRLILVGVAVNACFSGLNSAFSVSYTGAASLVNGNISLQTWSEARLLLICGAVGLICCMVLARQCNLLALTDQTAHGLGVRVNRSRFLISVFSVLMAGVFTAVIGSVSFLGLVVPHIARLLVGSNHKVLIPYSALLGALIFLLADTVGRTIAYPYEISASVIMAVVGGPAFIVLLKRSKRLYG